MRKVLAFLYRCLVAFFPEIPREQPRSKYLWCWREDIWDLDPPYSLYLRRFILFRSPIRGDYVHQIVRSDNDRCPHDHPWHFSSFILWGGYWEETANETERYQDGEGQWYERPVSGSGRTHKWYGPGSFRRMDAAHTHRVLLRKRSDGTEIPCWSYVVVSGKQRYWGFWTGKGWVPWRTFIAGEREC